MKEEREGGERQGGEGREGGGREKEGEEMGDKDEETWRGGRVRERREGRERR